MFNTGYIDTPKSCLPYSRLRQRFERANGVLMVQVFYA